MPWFKIASVLIVALFAANIVWHEFSLTPEQRAARQAASAAADIAKERANDEAERQRNSPDAIARDIYVNGTHKTLPRVTSKDGVLRLVVEKATYSTASDLRLVALIDAKDFFARVFSRHPDVGRIEIIQRATLVDLRGNPSMDDVLRVAVTKSNADTINWVNFRPENLPRVADQYWEHPLFKRLD